MLTVRMYIAENSLITKRHGSISFYVGSRGHKIYEYVFGKEERVAYHVRVILIQWE